MLIHLQGQVKNNKIVFDLPPVRFRRGQNVAVAECGIEWSNTGRYTGEITSTLVDKSPCNPKQQIFHINKQSGSNYTFTTPTPFLEYKIQCLDLESSVFKIHVYSQDEKRFFNCIKGVYLILRISDARVQYGPPTKTN